MKLCPEDMSEDKSVVHYAMKLTNYCTNEKYRDVIGG